MFANWYAELNLFSSATFPRWVHKGGDALLDWFFSKKSSGWARSRAKFQICFFTGSRQSSKSLSRTWRSLHAQARRQGFERCSPSTAPGSRFACCICRLRSAPDSRPVLRPCQGTFELAPNNSKTFDWHSSAFQGGSNGCHSEWLGHGHTASQHYHEAR